MDNNTICLVTNRSAGKVVYRIPEDNVRREFAIGESKRIPYGELVKLTFQPGGRELMTEFLQIQEDKVVQDLGINAELEYKYSHNDIRDLLTNGSLDAFLDCLDFAPSGVIDIVKRLAVELPLQDYNKRKALKDKTGFDVDTAIRNIEAEKADESEVVAAKPTRRVAASAPERRVPEYKVVSKAE